MPIKKEYNLMVVLPILFTSVFTLVIVFSMAGALFAEHIFVRSSSTSALNILFMPVIVAIYGFKVIKAAAIGLLCGLLVSSLLHILKLRTISQHKLIYLGIAPAIVAILIAGGTGYHRVKKYNTPGIIYSSGQISKNTVPSKAFITSNSPISFEESERGNPLFWNDKQMKLSFSSDEIRVTDSNGNIIIETSLHAYDYICEVSFLEVKLFPNEQHCLVVLAELRATSFHTILLIYSAKGELIYQEMFERDRDSLKMSIDKLNALNLEKLIIKNKNTYLCYSQISSYLKN